MQPGATVIKAYAQAVSDRALTGSSNSADSSFGCGGIVSWANLQLGERVLDLGSGAGSDCVEAATIVGEDGLVIGIDFTPEMVDLASSRVSNLRLRQARFTLGDIRSIPLSNSQIDVVISNCTLNLVHERLSVLKEAFRVLQPRGRLLLSEIVLTKALDESEIADADCFVNCISGATTLRELVCEVEKAGFIEVAPIRMGSLRAYGAESGVSPNVESKIGSVLLRARKPGTSAETSRLQATRILMLGASEAALSAARHYGLRPTLLARPESEIPALDAFDIVPFDGSPDDALRACREMYVAADVRGVVAFDGPYVGIAQQLAQHFGGACRFPGALVESGENKVAARGAMKAAGVSIPSFWFGTDLQAGLEWSSAVGWPIVAKPANDANSRMVRLCRNYEDLFAAFQQILSATYNIGGGRLVYGVLLEEFIEGPEFSVEIIASANESPTVVAVCEKLLGPEPFFVEIGHAVPPSLRAKPLEAVKSMAIQAVKALGVINIVCHVEVRLADNGPVVIEVNLRPPGGKLPELICLTSGWDLSRAAVELACGFPLHAPLDEYAPCGIYHCITTDSEAVIEYEKKPVELEGVRFTPYVEIDVAPGTTVYPVNHVRGQVLGRILAFGRSPSEAWNDIRKIKQSLNLTFIPSSTDEKTMNYGECSGCWEKGCC